MAVLVDGQQLVICANPHGAALLTLLAMAHPHQNIERSARHCELLLMVDFSGAGGEWNGRFGDEWCAKECGVLGYAYT